MTAHPDCAPCAYGWPHVTFGPDAHEAGRVAPTVVDDPTPPAATVRVDGPMTGPACHPMAAVHDHDHAETGLRCHHAEHGPIVCRDCPGWRDYRCATCGAGHPTQCALYRDALGRWQCWPHYQTNRAEPMTLGL